MSYRYTLAAADTQVLADGSDSGIVRFSIRDDAATGSLANSQPDTASFDPTWPLTKATLQSLAVAAIIAKYPGATEDA